MFKLIDKIFSSFSIKKIIYLGLFSMALSVLSISSLFIYISKSIEKSNSTISDIVKLKEQAKYILNSMGNISEVEMKIISAKDLKEFDVIDEISFEEMTSLEKINLLSNINTKDYNQSLSNIQKLLDEYVEIKTNMSELSYSIISYNHSLSNSLVLIEKELKIITNLTELISGKIKLENKRDNRKLAKALKNGQSNLEDIIPDLVQALIGNKDKISRDINELQKAVTSLTVIAREINIATSYDTLNDIKTNKIVQARSFLEKKVSDLINRLDDKELKDIVLQMTSHIIRIGELEDSLITLKEFSFIQRKELDNLMLSRNEKNTELIENIEVLSNIAKKINTEIIGSFEKTSKNTISLIIIILILVAFFLFSFGWLLLSRVNKPLAHITKSIEGISTKKNNLHTNIEVRFNDEYKKLVDAFNKMASSLSINIKKLKRRDKEISLLNKDLEKRVERRTEELSKKTQKIADLFNNAKQGFLSFDNNLIVDAEYSVECEKLLGKEIAGRNVVDLFYKSDNDKKEFFYQTLEDIFNEENDVIQNSYISLLQKEFILNKRALTVEYKRLNDSKIMLIITNITAQKKLERRIKNEQQILKMIVTIVSDPEQFYEVLNEFRTFEANKLKIFDLNNSSLFNLSETYRDIHTFKGLFAQLYMSNIVKKLHTFESEISEHIKDKDFSNDNLKNLLERNNFYSWLENDLEVISSILGDTFIDEESHIKINEKSVIKLEEKISDYCKIDKKHANNYEDLLNETQKLRSRTLYQALQVYPRLCVDLADKLNKQIYPFKILGDETIILPPNFKPFIKSLIHVFRNLIDHGIEDVERRLELNKNENGSIVCSFKIEDDSLVILVSDDGGGISKEKIKEKVIEAGMLSLEEFDKMNDERVFGLIFYESFSTSEKITDISGRGIGLSAVKNELVKIKGNVEIKSIIDEGTTFIFKLPYKREGMRNV
ncbi:ATP-binding protein [Arcobacter sp. LA11]|uniref:ATP-binding protein n=1 Tax=Arcobacter sp. LA11 TaxID=1898176 RepID=UPI000934D236|nr:ATP-binding protein [Arcobacter sp. LA11]